MPRGRMKGNRTLKDSVDDKDIVVTDEERNAPNFIIEDNEWGIRLDEYNYILVHRKIAYRTGKEEDGDNFGKVIQYIMWEDISYHPDIFGCWKSYFIKTTMSQTKQFKKEKDYSMLIPIYEKAFHTIEKCASQVKIDNSVKESADVMTMIQELRAELKTVNDVLSEAEELRNLIKEKRTLIMKDTEEKKHRLKLEKE